MILGISGGKKGGNTDYLVKLALEECKKAGHKTDFLNLWAKEIKPCLDCGVCKTGDCPISDDMNSILGLMEKADGIIIGSPVYFGSVSSHISLLFERSLPARRHDFRLRNKVGGGIAVGGSKNGGQEFVLRTITNFFTLHDMVVVGDSMPTAHFGGAAQGRNTGDASKDEDGVATVKNLGKKVAEVLNLTR
ncbi:MAG: flavodoxin family protein [Candidatus Altiarchaeota archaeon]|nr:flavodoxin family protein [Candidatus Altiarchaeota archaeon]